MPSLGFVAFVAVLAAALAVPLGAQAAPVTKVYSSGNLNVADGGRGAGSGAARVRDPGLTSVELPVADIGTVLDVNLRLRMNHVTDAARRWRRSTASASVRRAWRIRSGSRA